MTDPVARKPNETRGEDVPAESAVNFWDPKIIAQIDALVQLAAKPGQSQDNADLVREMIVTALKAEYADLDRGDVKILSRSLRELRYGFRVFHPYRGRRKVTIFGSARTPKTHREYKQAREFAKRMAKEGFMIITGAGPGIMAAGNEGAGSGNSFGVAIRLPFEQDANEFISKNPLFIDCRFFFTRKLMFLKETSAAAFFPGGFGTHDEGMETLTLIQTGKADPMPLVFVDPAGTGYWAAWHRYVLKHMLAQKRISEADLSLYKVTSSIEDAVAEITGFYRNYHSIRYVKDDLVVRLRRAPDRPTLDALSKDFKDICLKGGFRLTEPFPEEREVRELPRLAFAFKRAGFGRLRQLIDRLNRF